jgi:putative urate catabolism protein
MLHCPRDFVGYGREVPDASWPGGARLALQFVLNYEEGVERNILEGGSEAALTEVVNDQPLSDDRNLTSKSIYEYGARTGVWRILRAFEQRNLPLTVFAVGRALERNPEVASAFTQLGHEIACHGYRWINYRSISETDDCEHIRKAIAAIVRLTGSRPRGWYTGRVSLNTRRLVVEEGGLLYDSDSYADELPYWDDRWAKAQLVVPYTFDANDMRFVATQGFGSGDQFFAYPKDSFDVLYREGADKPGMMSVGLHCRLAGRPGRAASLERFLDYATEREKVRICRRIEIARHGRAHHPYSRGKAQTGPKA